MSDEQRGAGAPTDEERARAIREQIKNLRAFDLALEMMISLVSFGYQKLGLTDQTSELRNLSDARFAIELLRANLEVVEREHGEERTRDLRATLAQMQLGYAEAVRLAGDATQAPAVAEPAESESPAEPAGNKPAAGEPATSEPGEAAPAASEAAAPEKPPRRPSAAKKSSAKKPAARKPAAKKPAAKRPPAEKPRGGATPTGG